MATFRKIGVLTSGGDAPGMNPAVKAVVNRAQELGIEVVGINGGYSGLLENRLVNLTRDRVGNIVGEGGTFLYSSRCLEFKEEEGQRKAVAACRANGIDALVCIGGDGTFRGATDMTFHGIPSIGIPATIDNDITATDYTIGMDTAINTTVEMIDNLRDTCESHARCNVVEVMGNECGQIALYAAIASGAAVVAVPELPFDEAASIKRIADLRAAGKRNLIVVVAEGLKNPDKTPYSETLAKRIAEQTGIETKFARLAHIVRGGRPTMRDRVIPEQMAVKAVECLVNGKSNLVVCELGGKIETVDIAFALFTDKMYKNKLKPGDLDRFSAEDVEKMKAICEQRREEIQYLAKIASNVSF